jgi:cytochrome c oxidase assembly factor CtaG
MLPNANLSVAVVVERAPLALALLAAVLYVLGGRSVVPRRRVGLDRWRPACFAGGLLTIIAVTSDPFDRAADVLFWAHMSQHVALMEVAAPLVVIGRPWTRIARPLPLDVRRAVARGLARSRWTLPLRLLARAAATPACAFLAMNAGLVLWHVPAAYDAALASPTTHALEHLVFFASAAVFWAHLLGRGPFRRRLSAPLAGSFALGAMLVGWALAIVLAEAARPLYAHYAILAVRPGGISALADQQLAAGVMWVPASVPWTIALLASVYAWLKLGPPILHRESEATSR